MSIEAKQTKLARLASVYQRSLAEKIAELNASWYQLKSSPHSKQAFATFYSQLHNIAGSAGTFGFNAISRISCQIEARVAGLDTGAQILHREEITLSLAQLGDLAQANPEIESALPAAKTAEDNASKADTCIFIVEDDAFQAEEMATQLSAFGWSVKVFTNSALATQALNTTTPLAVIVDQILPEGNLGDTDLLAWLDILRDKSIPSIVVSAHWDWESRLAAARSGASAYLPMPVDYSQLTETLEQMVDDSKQLLYRVMIVEDSVLLAESYAQILHDAGMSVKIVIKPEEILQQLEEFRPELILMDLYMPGCSGRDTTRVIRQDPRYLSVPVVYLSTESGRQHQLAAMETGADDFLTKPIAPNQLVRAVTIRCQRFRSLTGMINQDSLTRLLNHTAFKLECEREISRSLRPRSNTVVAMLDIDHFKEVNDNYGHPVGDKVIVALAKLLKARLRKGDTIGRYGGEEFAVVMPNTSLSDAARVLNELRVDFARIIYQTAGMHFSCTFSAGLASMPAYNTLSDLLRVADEHLYHSKQTGRNRISDDHNWPASNHQDTEEGEASHVQGQL